jgi:hypothetical protein
MNLVSIKERIAISGDFTPAERDYILDAINAVDSAAMLADGRPSLAGRVDKLWAFFSIGDHGESICATKIDDAWFALVAVNKELVDRLVPLAKQTARMSGKPVRLANFSDREDVAVFLPT